MTPGLPPLCLSPFLLSAVLQIKKAVYFFIHQLSTLCLDYEYHHLKSKKVTLLFNSVALLEQNPGIFCFIFAYMSAVEIETNSELYSKAERPEEKVVNDTENEGAEVSDAAKDVRIKEDFENTDDAEDDNEKKRAADESAEKPKKKHRKRRQDTLPEEASESGEESVNGDDDKADEKDDEDDDEEGDLIEIDEANIILGGRRTRGKKIDYAKAAEDIPEDEDDDDEEEADFEDKGEEEQ